MGAGKEPGRGRRANAGSFSAGNPRPGPGRGKRKPLPPIGKGIAEDLRTAYAQAARPDDSAGVKAFRKLMRADLGTFLAIYLRVVGNSPSPQQNVSQTPAPIPEEPDEGTVRVRERITLLMRKLGVPDAEIEATHAEHDGVSFERRGEGNEAV